MGILVILVGTGISVAVLPGNKYVVGDIIYGLIGFFWVVIPNVLAYCFGKDVPFPPLFGTVADLEHRWHTVGVLVLAGLGVLVFHIALFPWPGSIQDLIELRDHKSHGHW